MITDFHLKMTKRQKQQKKTFIAASPVSKYNIIRSTPDLRGSTDPAKGMKISPTAFSEH